MTPVPGGNAGHFSPVVPYGEFTMAEYTPNLGLQRLGDDAPAAVVDPADWNAVVDALDRAGIGVAPVVITDATTYTFLAANSGKLHVAPDLTNDATWTLPAPEAGLRYRIWYGGAATDAKDWLITTGADANYFKGGVAWLTHTSGDAIDPVYSDGNSNSKLTVETPAAGTWLELWSDGTIWYLNGQVLSATTPVFADQ